MTLGLGWRDVSLARCRRALDSATSPADRAALLRTLAWLKGGRADLGAEGIMLLPADEAEQIRFGYRLSADRSVLWLRDHSGPEWSPDSIHVDPEDRRSLRTGSADAVLLRVTDRSSYRSLAQKGAVRALLTQKSGSGLLASMPTGAGKSLVFQMASLFRREQIPGACIAVIVPTVALAIDHERSLQKMRGLENSQALLGDLSTTALRERLDAFRRGEVPVLLLGPEMALREDVQAALEEAASPEPAAFGLNARLTHLVVDEAHIVETWGRSFRPDFQRLPALLRRLRAVDPSLRLILLSATLPPAARRMLKRDWGTGTDWCEVDARVPRYEHDVLVASFKDIEARNEALDHAIDRIPRPTILYTTEVEVAKALYRQLTMRGYTRLGLFTGSSGSEDRRAVVKAWADDALDIVVATSAFGMGVDKPDVRSVVHACLPEGPSRWYQEIGRAARDGGQGIAVLLFTDNGSKNDDVETARGLAQSGWLTRNIAELRWEAMKNSQRREWVGAHLRLHVDLDAVREGLGARSSDYNRAWNRSLLMLMQRAGMIEVTSVSGVDSDARQIWTVDVKDAQLLGTSAATWDKIFELREREATEAKAMFDPFLRGARNLKQNCLTQLAFELIEPSALPPPCGRCPHCRSQHITPPAELSCGGLDAAWASSTTFQSLFGPGVTLIEPEDFTTTRGLGTLVRRLTAMGVDQWVLPDEMAAEVAAIVATIPCAPGIIITFTEWTDTAILAELPTALILPIGEQGKDEMLERYVNWVKLSADRIGALVTDPSRRVRGRRLDQWASQFAPIAETALPLPPNLVEASS